ncbi:MAG: class I SAM-dependent methyltransferase [Deltaproteobacteria bacterium]|nr:class I SAM-dependent methyltransferase [Deltaproteobacteria bacterium]
MANNEKLTSAEMTAYWRSRYPELSGDRWSALLVSKEGIKLANRFKTEVYPLIEHHLALRHRFFFNRAAALLRSGHYDSCISIGSGLSLLVPYLTEVAPKLCYYDADLSEVLEMRETRLKKVKEKFKNETWGAIQSRTIDLEKAATKKKKLKSVFPEATSPIFILEGVFFYLTSACLEWFFRELETYGTSAVIFDYWPKYSEAKSEVTRKMVTFLNTSIREKIQRFQSADEFKKLAGSKRIQEDSEIRDIESEFVKTPLLTEINEIVPARYVVVV